MDIQQQSNSIQPITAIESEQTQNQENQKTELSQDNEVPPNQQQQDVNTTTNRELITPLRIPEDDDPAFDFEKLGCFLEVAGNSYQVIKNEIKSSFPQKDVGRLYLVGRAAFKPLNDQKDVDTLIQNIHGKILNRTLVRCTQTPPMLLSDIQKLQNAYNIEASKSLVVFNVDKTNTKAEELQELFQQYGKVEDAYFITKYVGCVTFEDLSNAEKAKNGLQGKLFKNSELILQYISDENKYIDLNYTHSWRDFEDGKSKHNHHMQQQPLFPTPQRQWNQNYQQSNSNEQSEQIINRPKSSLEDNNNLNINEDNQQQQINDETSLVSKTDSVQASTSVTISEITIQTETTNQEPNVIPSSRILHRFSEVGDGQGFSSKVYQYAKDFFDAEMMLKELTDRKYPNANVIPPGVLNINRIVSQMADFRDGFNNRQTQHNYHHKRDY
ncbi:MAG: hypothetical protein EZS28_018071, partial [Streblomastix strix]